ncbi:MAG TPA: ADP-ribosylglycohydrolase family protein [Kineosporiaceae bacterium]|nr:ADP-ribosylglycohydrolase family protein [Kineosporiaceae bacterium]
MLLELAVGDAYGAGFEYVDPAIVARENTLAGYIQHPRHAIAPGRYTDDTQMSLAIAETLVSGRPWTAEVLADAFVQAFKRDPREGYASRFYDFLTEVSDGEEFLARIHADSDKSGAAMRAAPIGVLSKVAQVLDYATVQARVTHDTPDGIAAACAAALTAHYFIYRLGDKGGLGDFLEHHVPGRWAVPWTGKVGAQGMMSVRAAVTALTTASSMSEMLRHCIAFTGDVDTVAAIALAAGAHSDELVQDLPEHLIHHLEAGPFGRDYIVSLDAQLMALRGP